MQLAPGSSATLSMTIPASQLSTAPATIPLWYFDETNGIWVEEGTATKVGDKYIGTVTHFTDWNCDVFSETQATITGKVVDCSGKPVSYVIIQTGQSYAFTNERGEFSRRVPSGFDLEVKVESGYYQTYTSSTILSVPALSAGQVYDAGSISLDQCIQTIEGTLTGCNGQKIPSYIISDNNFIGYVENGDFSLTVDLSASTTITAYDFLWGFASITVPSSSSSSNSIGNIQVCTETTPVGENSFVIDGDGYFNKNILLSTPNDLSYNYYTYGEKGFYADSVGSSLYYLYVNANGYFMEGGVEKYAYVYFQIENNVPIELGSYALNSYFYTYNDTTNITYPRTTGMIDIYDDLTDGYYETNTSGMFNLTRMDEVGGLIEGTFYGTFNKGGTYVFNNDSTNFTYTPGAPVTITNGKISVLRYPDYNYNYKAEKSALREKVLENRQRFQKHN